MTLLLARFPRRVPVLLASAALAVVLVPGVADAAPPDSAAPEQAPAPVERCPDPPEGVLCAWPEPDFGGDVTQITPGRTATCHPLARPATSTMNDTSGKVEFFESEDCSGESVLAVPGGERSPSFLRSKSLLLAPGGGKEYPDSDRAREQGPSSPDGSDGAARESAGSS